jgi:hypothetical protein
MRTILSIIILLSSTINNDFKKRIIPYGIVISKADLIIEGKVSNNSKNNYDFSVTEFIKGQSLKNIYVKKWGEWTCDKRIQKIEKGQRLILFLNKIKENEYEVINGSTGELFVENNNSVKTFMKSDFPSVNKIKSGIKSFLKAFEFKGTLEYNEEKYFNRLIEQSKIDKIMNENKFFKSIVRGIKYFTVK